MSAKQEKRILGSGLVINFMPEAEFLLQTFIPDEARPRALKRKVDDVLALADCLGLSYGFLSKLRSEKEGLLRRITFN